MPGDNFFTALTAALDRTQNRTLKPVVIVQIPIGEPARHPGIGNGPGPVGNRRSARPLRRHRLNGAPARGPPGA